MPKINPLFSIISYGIYEQWNADSKKLPNIQEFTTEIPAKIDIEFGLILSVKKGKGIKLNFTIFHPDISDENGVVMAPFEGEVYVDNNDWRFFLGDTIWEPIENKVGIWRIVIKYFADVIAEKNFNITLDSLAIVDDFALLNRKFRQRNR